MSEIVPEDSIPKESTNLPDNNNQNVTIKKSTYRNLLASIVVAIAISTFFIGYFVGTSETNDDSISSEDFTALITAIKDVNQPAAPQPTVQPTPARTIISSVSLDDDPFKGNPDAPVTIVEFSDFQCPFCSRFYQQTLPQLEEEYISTGKVKFVYRDFPLESIHPNAIPAHIAAECADEQEMFWEYHDVLFDKVAEWQRLGPADLNNQFTKFATNLGLEGASFESCLSSPEMAEEVNKDLADAASYGATGTPTFFIGNEEDGFVKFVGAQPFSSFQLTIDGLLS